MHGAGKGNWFYFAEIARRQIQYMQPRISTPNVDALVSFLLAEDKIIDLNNKIQVVTRQRPNHVSQDFYQAVNECFSRFCDRSFKNVFGKKKLFKILPSFATSWVKKRFVKVNNSALKTQFIETWDAMTFATVSGQKHRPSSWTEDFLKELLHQGDVEKFDYTKDPETAIIQKGAELIQRTPRLDDNKNYLHYAEDLPVRTLVGLFKTSQRLNGSMLKPAK